MGRQRREFVRRGGFRDDALFVIASEGAVTEPRYFNGLRERLHTPRIHIHVLQKDDPTLRSPAHVLGELDRFRSTYTLRDGDQLWLVIDRDAWKPERVSSIAQECQAKGYFLAVSNPCFEIWLLLHFEDVPNQPEPRRQELAENAGGLLTSLVGCQLRPGTDYIDHFLPNLDGAIARAEALDTRPEDRWPTGLGTHVHRLVRHWRPGSC